MKAFTIEPTNVTPYVQMDPENGILCFKGRSSPKATLEFFTPIIQRIKTDFADSSSGLTVDFEFEYFNTSSSKCLYDILKQLSLYSKQGINVTVNWRYEDWDDDMRETGEDYEEILGMPFNYVISHE